MDTWVANYGFPIEAVVNYINKFINYYLSKLIYNLV